MIMMIREQELKDQGRAEGRAEGRMEGRAEGRVEGRAEGLTVGENRMAALVERLFRLNRGEDAVRAAGDPEYRRQLYEVLNIDDSNAIKTKG